MIRKSKKTNLFFWTENVPPYQKTSNQINVDVPYTKPCKNTYTTKQKHTMKYKTIANTRKLYKKYIKIVQNNRKQWKATNINDTIQQKTVENYIKR